MTLGPILDEYNLTLDDIRWYCSRLVTESLLQAVEDPDAITRRIWSGALEGELYNMEEAFLARLADDLDRGLTDKQAIRDHFEKARIWKLQRPR